VGLDENNILDIQDYSSTEAKLVSFNNIPDDQETELEGSVNGGPFRAVKLVSDAYLTNEGMGLAETSDDVKNGLVIKKVGNLIYVPSRPDMVFDIAGNLNPIKVWQKVFLKQVNPQWVLLPNEGYLCHVDY